MISELRHRLHWTAGVAALALFLLSGMYMRWISNPPVEQLDGETRAVYRSRHMFLLLAAVANLSWAAGNARHTRWTAAGSAVLLMVPLLFLPAFFHEPPRGVAGRAFSTPALYALFGVAVVFTLTARCPEKSYADKGPAASK